MAAHLSAITMFTPPSLMDLNIVIAPHKKDTNDTTREKGAKTSFEHGKSSLHFVSHKSVYLCVEEGKDVNTWVVLPDYKNFGSRCFK